jgi:hypothetical protein
MNQKDLQKRIQEYIKENGIDKFNELIMKNIFLKYLGLGDGVMVVKPTKKRVQLVDISLSKSNKRYFFEVGGKSTELTEVQAEIFEVQKLFLNR